jgi:hypothetical protein
MFFSENLTINAALMLHMDMPLCLGHSHEILHGYLHPVSILEFNLRMGRSWFQNILGIVYQGDQCSCDARKFRGTNVLSLGIKVTLWDVRMWISHISKGRADSED